MHQFECWYENTTQGNVLKLGKQQQYELGKFLRRRYNKFLGNTYSADQISILSSDIDRTINSATLVLAALFPPKDSRVWNKDLLWQPIAVHTIPEKMDYLITGEMACARYLKVLEEHENSTEVRALIEPNQDLFRYLEKHAGQPVRTLEDLKNIHNILEVEYQFNKT